MPNLSAIQPLGIACAALLFAPIHAEAQTIRGCTTVRFTDPPRDVLQCRGGLTVAAERDTRYSLIDSNRDGRPEAAELSGRALLIDLAPGGRRGSFQILTPHAIASVRGTVYAVDVQAQQTSVFVAEGRVSVASRSAPESVTLGPGQGVDVVPGQRLEAKTWGLERKAGLLARFGR
jgi:hypothetical protein